jgi:hypothetical protein
MGMTETYFETFAATVDGAMSAAADRQAVLAKPTEIWNLCQDALSYGQTRFGDFELESLKGRPTRKFFHVAIYRLETGRYELTAYVL